MNSNSILIKTIFRWFSCFLAMLIISGCSSIATQIDTTNTAYITSDLGPFSGRTYTYITMIGDKITIANNYFYDSRIFTGTGDNEIRGCGDGYYCIPSKHEVEIEVACIDRTAGVALFMFVLPVPAERKYYPVKIKIKAENGHRYKVKTAIEKSDEGKKDICHIRVEDIDSGNIIGRGSISY